MIDIKPIEIHQSNFEEQIFPTQWCFPSEVRKLEADYKELLSTYIFDIQYQIAENMTDLNLDLESATFIYEDQIKMLERLTGQKWEDLRSQQ